MAYDTPEHMTYDEYTYEVDCLLIGETGEPASQEQLCAIASGYKNGLTPWDCLSVIVDCVTNSA